MENQLLLNLVLLLTKPNIKLIMLLRIISETKVSSDWFRCVLVIPFYVAKVFSELITKSYSRFTNV